MFSHRLESCVLSSAVSLMANRNFSSSKQHLASKNPRSSSTYCVELIQKRDYEHFLATLLLPKEVRPAAIALRAFNVEVASVRDSVTDQNIGKMRMQFWKDALESIFDSSGKKPLPQHPVILELKKAVDQHNLSQDLLQKLVLSRDGMLADKPFLSVDEVDKYSEQSVSSLNYLLLECLPVQKDETKTIKGHARHSANQLGKAEGMVTLLRAIPHNAKKRKVILPADLLSTHKISSESIIRGTASEDDKFKHVVQVLARRAEEHLENARFRRKFLSRDEKLILLPAVAVDRYLTRLHKADCNIFHPDLIKRDSWLPVSLLFSKLKKTF